MSEHKQKSKRFLKAEQRQNQMTNFNFNFNIQKKNIKKKPLKRSSPGIYLVKSFQTIWEAHFLRVQIDQIKQKTKKIKSDTFYKTTIYS